MMSAPYRRLSIVTGSGMDAKPPAHVSRCSQQIESPLTLSPEISTRSSHQQDDIDGSTSKWRFWEVSSPSFRFFALILATLIPFGGHVVKSSVASIAPLMVDDKEFGLSHVELGSFQSIVSLPNLIVPILGGLWLDVKGSRYGTLVAVLLCTLGQLLFAFGCSLHSYPIALCARFIFGLGQGSTVVAQGRLAAKWFMGKELVFAIALTESLHNAAGFIGTTLSAYIATTFNAGYIGALYMGALFCSISAISGIALFFLLPDNDTGSHSPMETNSINDDIDSSESIRIVDHGESDHENECCHFRKFSMGFITLCVLHMIFSNTYHLFGFVLSSIMNSEWSYSVNASSLLGGLQYALAIVLCPLLGFVLDRYKTSTMLFCVSAGLISSVCYLSLAYHMMSPLLPLILLACCISFVPTVLRASVPFYISPRLYGAGYGCYEISESAGAVFGHLLVGYTRDSTHSYTESLQLFALLATLASCISMLLHFMRKSSNHVTLMSEDGIEYKPIISDQQKMVTWSADSMDHKTHSSMNSKDRVPSHHDPICPETPVSMPGTPYYGSIDDY